MQSTLNQTEWKQLCQIAQEKMTAANIPGMSIGILNHGERLTAGFGITNINHPLEVTDNTLFQIGSNTKTVTGLIIMRLAEERLIDIDRPVQAYLPDFAVSNNTASTQVTPRHLMTHTAGWVGDFFIDTGPGDDAVAKYVKRMRELPQLAPFGTQWSYNNAGFCLLGHLIETITGQSYQQAAAQYVFEPLNMHSSYFEAADVMIHRFAVGHYERDGQLVVGQPWPLSRAVYAAGAVTCDIQDLLTYAAFQLGDGKAPDGRQLLSPENMQEMHRPQAPVATDISWALTWQINDSYGQRAIMHGGATVGQLSGFLLVPEAQFAIGVLTNADAGRAVSGQIIDEALKLFLALEKKSRPLQSGVTPSDLDQYVGNYLRPMVHLNIWRKEDQLWYQVIPQAGFPTEDTPPAPPSPPATLAIVDASTLRVTSGPASGTELQVIRHSDQSINWVRASMRLHAKQK